MAIIEISREEFDSYEPARMLFVSTEKAWYADNQKNIIGTVTKDNFDKDWGYAILGRHEDGLFRFLDGDVSKDTFDEAESLLFHAMSNMEMTDIASEKLFETDESPDESKYGSLIVTDINYELKRYLSKHPEKLYDLSPRKFEELIASIFVDLGFDVQLTQATRDGGSDIIAYIRNAVCEYLTLVECKKYSPNNKVGVGIIREVTGVHHIKKATKSIIVTTSFFSPDAIKEAAAFEHQLELKDYEAVKAWLRQCQ
ncbi:MAG: restriction endonuclease [Desulfocapsaceae bacterium]|nr:restriction endonuclease [Desulfocapsaceae bacterium]